VAGVAHRRARGHARRRVEHGAVGVGPAVEEAVVPVQAAAQLRAVVDEASCGSGDNSVEPRWKKRCEQRAEEVENQGRRSVVADCSMIGSCI
jgi:hypothetical protein